MATHSSILAWTVEWTEKLQSMSSQRAGHDLANAHTHTFIKGFKNVVKMKRTSQTGQKYLKIT